MQHCTSFAQRPDAPLTMLFYQAGRHLAADFPPPSVPALPSLVQIAYIAAHYQVRPNSCMTTISKCLPEAFSPPALLHFHDSALAFELGKILRR